jgi:HPt (histidine-containing phosphotransfer) domain-containing protein
MQKLYDTQNLFETHRGDAVFVKHIAQLFVQHMPVMVEELNKAYSKSDWQNVYFYAHKMKSSIDLFGIKDISTTIRTIEQQGKAAADTEILSRDIKHVLNVITECIDQLKKEFEITA